MFVELRRGLIAMRSSQDLVRRAEYSVAVFTFRGEILEIR